MAFLFPLTIITYRTTFLIVYIACFDTYNETKTQILEKLYHNHNNININDISIIIIYIIIIIKNMPILVLFSFLNIYLPAYFLNPLRFEKPLRSEALSYDFSYYFYWSLNSKDLYWHFRGNSIVIVKMFLTDTKYSLLSRLQNLLFQFISDFHDDLKIYFSDMC